MEAKLIKLDELVEFPQNAKSHDLGSIHASISEWGYIERIVVNETTGHILSGHGRTTVLRQLQASHSPAPEGIVEDNGSWMVPVDFVSVPESQEGAVTIALNRTVELGGWDNLKLAELLQEVANSTEVELKSTGYDGDDLDDLLREVGRLGEPPEDPGAQVNKADELREKWGVQLGQIWRLGDHKLMCGDSSEAGDINKILDGIKIDLCLTDPPYGIDVVKVKDGSTAAIGGAKPVTIGTVRSRRKYPFGGVKNIGRATDGGTGMVDATMYRPVIGDDKPFDPIHLMDLANNQIIFGGNYFASKLSDSRCWIVWDKNNTGNFADAELAWTSFKTGVKLYKFTWNGLVREGKREVEGVKRVHPTQKPVGLFSMILNDYSNPGDVIIDPYSGSGTTLIACEILGRSCIGLEIDPGYCAVILQRWEDLTGESPVLISSYEDDQ